MSIGTLLAYTMVSACVIILRYKQTEEDRTHAKENNLKIEEAPFLQQFFNRSSQKVPTEASSLVAGVATLLIGWQTTLQEKLKLRITAGVFSFAFCIVLANYRGEMSRGTGLGIFLVFRIILSSYPILWFKIVFVCVNAVILALLMAAIFLQPESVEFVAFKVLDISNCLPVKLQNSFQVPGVPFVPCISILLNVYLMASLDIETWAKFLAWMAIGKWQQRVDNC